MALTDKQTDTLKDIATYILDKTQRKLSEQLRP